MLLTYVLGVISLTLSAFAAEVMKVTKLFEVNLAGNENGGCAWVGRTI
jgi:hypothetical protein